MITHAKQTLTKLLVACCRAAWVSGSLLLSRRAFRTVFRCHSSYEWRVLHSCLCSFSNQRHNCLRDHLSGPADLVLYSLDQDPRLVLVALDPLYRLGALWCTGNVVFLLYCFIRLIPHCLILFLNKNCVVIKRATGGCKAPWLLWNLRLLASTHANSVFAFQHVQFGIRSTLSPILFFCPSPERLRRASRIFATRMQPLFTFLRTVFFPQLSTPSCPRTLPSCAQSLLETTDLMFQQRVSHERG